MSTREELLREIADFQRRTGIGDAAFGRAVLNDPSWLTRLRDGADAKISTVDAVRAYMRGYKPPKHPRMRADARAVA